MATTISGLAQHSQHIVDRGLDEVGLPEQDVGRGDALRQDVLRDSLRAASISRVSLSGVGAGLLLHAEDDGGLARYAGVAALDARPRSPRRRPGSSRIG